MAFDWTKNDETDAPRLPVGEEVDVQITRLVFTKKDGTPFRSQAGDPKIMAVFADDAGREAAFMFTLSDRAAWQLRSVLSCAGADLARMKADNIEPSHFANERFATANLVGRRLRIRVKGYVREDGNLADGITPIRTVPRPLRADPVGQALGKAVANATAEGPIPEDEIPF